MEIDELPENNERLLKKPENQLDKHRSVRRAVAEYDARKDGASKITAISDGASRLELVRTVDPPEGPIAWRAKAVRCIRCVAGMERCGICVSRQQGKVPISG
jgi:hypothetical protein